MYIKLHYGEFLFTLNLDSLDSKWITFSYTSDSIGIVKFNDTGWTKYTSKNSGLPSNDVDWITVDKNNNKLIGTSNGIVLFNDTSWTIYNSYGGSFVGSDGLGNNWFFTSKVETINGGLYKVYTLHTIDDANNVIYYNNNPLLIPETYGVHYRTVASDGTVWFSYDIWMSMNNKKTKFAKFNGKEWIQFENTEIFSGDKMIRSITIDTSGNKWIIIRGRRSACGPILVFNEGAVK